MRPIGLKFKNESTIQSHRECAGKDCSKQGFCCLRVRFINKYGWFCDSCRDTLVKNKLADEVSDNVANEAV